MAPKPKGRREYVWRHNSFLGHAKMMGKNCRVIATSPSTTPEAKGLAHQIEALAQQLSRALAHRVDPE